MKKVFLAIAWLASLLVVGELSARYAMKGTRIAYVKATLNAEAFNDLHRIRSWDSLEQLMIKGCNKEALEYVRIEQSLGLLSLKDHIKNGAKLDKALEAENPSILGRANAITNKGKYYIPSCQ